MIGLGTVELSLISDGRFSHSLAVFGRKELFMQFWILMLSFDLITPALMAIGGYIMKKHPPKSISALIGYRTELSMKNADTWKFAHEHCGGLWLKVGLIMLIPSAAPFIALTAASQELVAAVGLAIMLVQLTALVICIFQTERALKKKFNTNGT